ncbi:MAG TPA: toll/interleukin-1 receptor domain-containing protein [Thermoanaerobaculia bacterium]|jgi:hypothetical protein|nr:toll/interleukin-1 receptor domain-containing protein [Thermoanaerobaculia bacterium]
MAAVFISHLGADALAAERLGRDLRERGHVVWLDAWEIQVGDSIVEKINSGLAGTSHLVLCYSAAGVPAPWMSREWMAALAMQLNGHAIRLLPVRLTGGQPPALLADIRYADLVTDWDTGLAELLRALV